MYRQLVVPIVALWAVAGAAGWQGPLYDRVIVNLPYPVMVQEKTLPPGEYVIEEQRSPAKTGILYIKSDSGMSHEATVTTIPALDNRTPEETRLVLDRYGDEYYLNKMWIQGKNYGYEFQLPEAVKAREKERRESTLTGRFMRADQADQRSGAAAAKPQAPAADRGAVTSDRGRERLIREVRHELVMLPYYGVFDNLAYSVNGDVVTLSGQVTRPTLKSDAENVVKNIEGVSKVVNNIEVLPNSPNDDRLRLALFRAIYGDTQLSRYAIQAVPPIHIIVKNGNATLEGVVASEADKNIAEVRAKGVSGVFSVNNNLRVEGAQKG
jgi:hyperosmotically inducible periplasmic protein